MLSFALLWFAAAAPQDGADARHAALEALAHDGRLAGAEAGLEEHPLHPLALNLAALAPPWTRGAPTPEAERRAASAFVLDAWLKGSCSFLRDLVPARLTGHVDEAAALRLAAALRAPLADGPSADQIAALLKSAPAAISAPALLAAARDEKVHPGVRGDLASTLILLRGREAILALQPILQPDADERLLRQVFPAWRQVAALEDTALLERIAFDGSGSPTQYALQLWARLERDPRQRLRILEAALEAPGGYAHLTLDALGAAGPAPELAARLRELLRVGTATQRGLALRGLARLDSPAAVLAEFRNIGAPPSLAAAGWWMPALAQSPLPEARAAAARWLAEGGFGAGALAYTVVRSLGDSPEILPLLGNLLARDDVPANVSLPLAIAHAPVSPVAAEFLRGIARSGRGFEQVQAMQRLGAQATPEDLAWFAEVAGGTEFEPAVRGAACTQLLRNGAGAELLSAWIAEPPREWDLLEAMVRDGLAYGAPEQRAAILDFVRAGGGLGASEDRLALRAVAWSALGDAGDPANFPVLAAELRAVLELLAADGRPADEDWRDLYERVHAWPELESLSAPARRLAQGQLREPRDAALNAWNPAGTAPEVLWAAAALWSGADPAQASDWLEALDALELTDVNRLRVRALLAARARDPLREREALRALLADPGILRDCALIVAQSFAPEGAGWTLHHDRLAEREILADARCQPDPQALARLARLLEAWCEARILLEAGGLAAQLQGGEELALRLARRGVELHALHPELGVFLARRLEAAGDDAEARDAWAAVERMVPAGLPQHEEAAARRRELDAAAPAAGGR